MKPTLGHTTTQVTTCNARELEFGVYDIRLSPDTRTRNLAGSLPGDSRRHSQQVQVEFSPVLTVNHLSTLQAASAAARYMGSIVIYLAHSSPLKRTLGFLARNALFGEFGFVTGRSPTCRKTSDGFSVAMLYIGVEHSTYIAKRILL